MEIALIVIRYGQLVSDVNVFCKVHILPDESKEAVIVHGRIAVFFRQIIVFIRDNGQVDLTVSVPDVFFVNCTELRCGLANRVLFEGKLQFAGITIDNIDVVVVGLRQRIITRQRFE